MSTGKLKDCLSYFFEDANFDGNLWNSYPYLVLENSKFEIETLIFLGEGGGGAGAVRFDSKERIKLSTKMHLGTEKSN